VTKRHVPAPKKEEPPEDLCEEAPSKPVALQQPTQIEYTAQARADGVEGRLVLRVIVAADGTVTEVVVVQGVEAALDAGAVAAVKTWTFKPALRCGKPVAGGILTLARRFELGD
jgi:protein TonB